MAKFSKLKKNRPRARFGDSGDSDDDSDANVSDGGVNSGPETSGNENRAKSTNKKKALISSSSDDSDNEGIKGKAKGQTKSNIRTSNKLGFSDDSNDSDGELQKISKISD